VLPYGSVPLKTYLPDGDIDLTAVSCPNIDDSLVSDVLAVLRREEHNEAPPYEVKDVHCIDAEVFSTFSTFFFFFFFFKKKNCGELACVTLHVG
jgi:hypothetical protein